MAVCGGDSNGELATPKFVPSRDEVSDLAVGVGDRQTQVHRRPGGDTSIEGLGAEHAAETSPNCGKAGDRDNAAIGCAGAVEGGCDVGLIDSVEEHPREPG